MTACLITHIKNIRALTTVYAFKVYQMALSTECLITYFTNIRALTTVYAFMTYQTTLVNVCLITHIKNKGAHHCVCVYALSDCPVH